MEADRAMPVIGLPQDVGRYAQWTLDAHLASYSSSEALAIIGLSNNSIAATRLSITDGSATVSTLDKIHMHFCPANPKEHE